MPKLLNLAELGSLEMKKLVNGCVWDDINHFSGTNDCEEKKND